MLGSGLAVVKLKARLAEIQDEREMLMSNLARLTDNRTQMRAELEALRDRLGSLPTIDTHGDVSAAFVAAWHAMTYEQRKSLLREIVSSIQLEETAILVTFRAGISIPVPRVAAGRRKPDITEPLLRLGFGLPGTEPPSGSSLLSNGARVGNGTGTEACRFQEPVRRDRGDL
jgi:hypothetical protein